ncbi:hypothetical protein chiPu_0018528 [Chiloscyllium punctatum]|uniref:Ig-like domain-containing protein n=1 Tax=Chiloscyllium punctatum TaxID=137246 RepID=A0A401RNS6_CHIPU|nr:hypothetical protein [Chiloscyllium punctatum]
MLFALEVDIKCLLCFLLVLMAVVPGTSGQYSVSQDPTEWTIQEGHTTSLNCRYTAAELAGETLFWYIQTPEEAPRYLLQRYNKQQGDRSKDFTDRFSAHLDKEKKTIPLSISEAQVSDSAVYYCALSSTLIRRSSRPVQKPARQLYGLRLDKTAEHNKNTLLRIFFSRVFCLSFYSAKLCLNTSLYQFTFLERLIVAFCFLKCYVPDLSDAVPISQQHYSFMQTEGKDVTLNCNYTGDGYYLFWYRQFPGKPPEFPVRRHTSGSAKWKADFAQTRFSDAFQKTEDSYRLNISQLLLSDTAVYDCAINLTVTEWSEILVH